MKISKSQDPGIGSIFKRSAKPTPSAANTMKRADKVTDQFILFSPPKEQVTKAGLVFFPGAKVQEEAYAPLAAELAQIGVAVDRPIHTRKLVRQTSLCRRKISGLKSVG